MFGLGVPLCVEGDPGTHLYIILAGWAKVVSVTSEGYEMVLALRGPGDVIGELSGELDGLRTATVRAIVRVRALSISAERFAAFLDANPGATHSYRRMLTQRRRELDINLRGRMESSGAQRLARLLLDLAQRCGESTEHGITLAVPLSQTDIASWVGVSRATVTRALHQWRERNLISTRHGQVTIMDPVGLRRISGALTTAHQ